jgi:F-type H+-transporting ATPase subunit gamma
LWSAQYQPFREIVDQVKGPAKFITVGRKGTQFIARSQRDLLADFTVSDKADYSEIRALLKLAVDAYLDGTIDTIEIAYPSFVNVLVQEPVIQKLLPIVRPRRSPHPVAQTHQNGNHRPRSPPRFPRNVL